MESTGFRPRTGSIERRLVTTALAVLVLTSSMMTARVEAQANGSFETGDFSGWLLAGTSAASIVGLGFGSGPTDGAFQALVTNGPGETVSELQIFFATSGSAFPELVNGTAKQGAGVRQVFDAPAGTAFVVDWNFLTNEAPSGNFNDFAFAVVEGVADRLASANSAGLVPFSPSFNRQTGFHQFCFLAPGGVFSVGFGVVDVGDTNVDSAVLIDNLRLTDDSDGDGTAEPCDNCPGFANAGQADADHDGIGDACDACVGIGSSDADGDGICDGEDNCPSVSNPGQQDSDGDGVGDACNDADDADGDEWSNALDNCPAAANPTQADNDFDGFGDACDTCFGNGDRDRDGDGRCDGDDNCPGVSNPDQADSDFDGFGNACDTCVGPGPADSDSDGRCDGVDNCPTAFNPDQADRDFDGRGDVCDPCRGFSNVDADSDGICDEQDNCPTTANPSQGDCDFDGRGDACDINLHDADGDGVDDRCDNCPSLANADQADANGDGVGEACATQGKLDTTGCYRASDTLTPPDGTEPTFAFSDISSTGTVVPIDSHEASGAIPIGFNFAFYGTTYSQLFVSSNGFLTFIDGQGEGPSGGIPIPSLFGPRTLVAGLMAHLHPTVGQIVRQTFGAAPDRRFVLQFKDVLDVNQFPAAPQTWQIILAETTNQIEVQYLAASGDSVSAGIQDQTGTRGLQWAGFDSVSLLGQAVRYAPTEALTIDADGDGKVDCLDNCPAVANPGQEDADNDGIGDLCDGCVGPGAADPDGDGVCDLADNCPMISNPTQFDDDFDGLGNACDPCFGVGSDDTDADGICDLSDNCPDLVNVDQNDDDFDGVGNACDPCIGFSQIDDDGDGVCNERDNCPAVPNAAQTNCDFDALGDACDPDTVDADGDATADACDNCPGLANPGQEDSNGDGTGDACATQGRLDTRGCYRASDTIAPPDGSEPTVGFIDISSTGTVVPIQFHQLSEAIPIGFSFPFYGKDYSELFVSTNGFVSFVPGLGDGCCGSNIPSTFQPNGLVAGLWGHLHPDLGEVTAQTIGTAPNRQMVIEFKGVFDANFGRDETFEIILDEASGDIVVQYAQASNGIAGIEDPTGTMGLQWAGPLPLTLMNAAVRFAPAAGLTTDSDGDGAPDCVDNCPGILNPDQADTDSNGLGDACNDAEDTDGDEWADTLDNCPAAANTDQADGDFDGVGDVCDTCSIDGIRGPLEQCDDGNFDNFDCCSVTCIPASAGQPCGAAGACTVGGGVCDNTGVCQFNLLLAGTPCRDAAGPCDMAEECDGLNPECPPNQFRGSGAPCRPSAGQCDLSEFCNGFSPNCPLDAKGTQTCRVSHGPCDAPERCDGMSDNCPPDLDKPNGASCSDGAFCNGAEVCQSGACAVTAPACPGACDETTDTCTGCPSVAQSCRSAGKSLLVVKHPDDAATHKLIWKWLRGEGTLLSDFGDPRGVTPYLLCFYGGAAQTLVPGADISIPADATRWAPIGAKGFKYADATQASDGVQKVGLKSGADGKAKTMLIGKGTELPPLPLPLSPAQFPLTVQLLNGRTCWSSTFTDASHNDESGLKAKTN